MTDIDITERHDAYVSLASNSGDRRANLRNAVGSLPDLLSVSRVYETEPLSDSHQGMYLNLVVRLRTGMSPQELNQLCRDLEEEAIAINRDEDVDVLLTARLLMIEGIELDEPDLTLPWPKMWERRFVMSPLSDLIPEKLPRGWQARAVGNVTEVGSF